jgi:prepilin-type N-terminal cleavage/methylation domain-containing protein
MPLHRLRRRQRGFSLAEFLVASAIFLFVAVVAYTAFENSRRSYGAGENAAEMQQRTRLTFELMLEELRLAGFDYNRDGMESAYPDHPDEQLEWIGAAALAMRANLDYTNEESGRESDLETDPSDADFGEVCCPVVTTGNDEIVTYALRSTDPSKNVDSIELKVDLSAPRDAGWDPLDGTVLGEEVVEIPNLDFSNANPPYTLYRFHLDADGNVQARPMAENVRSLSFVYEDS